MSEHVPERVEPWWMQEDGPMRCSQPCCCAATADTGLRERVEALADNFGRRERTFTGQQVARRLRRALDATPASTETCLRGDSCGWILCKVHAPTTPASTEDREPYFVSAAAERALTEAARTGRPINIAGALYRKVNHGASTEDRADNEGRDYGAEVWCSPRRQSGQPCLAGTRMPTATIGALIRRGHDVARVQQMYPHLTEQQIWDAVEFESLNGRGKTNRKNLQRLMVERRRSLRGDL